MSLWRWMPVDNIGINCPHSRLMALRNVDRVFVESPFVPERCASVYMIGAV